MGVLLVSGSHETRRVPRAQRSMGSSLCLRVFQLIFGLLGMRRIRGRRLVRCSRGVDARLVLAVADGCPSLSTRFTKVSVSVVAAFQKARFDAIGAVAHPVRGDRR